MSLKKLIHLSHQIGKKTPLWVQGAGGNVSFKQQVGKSRILWIKPSGFRLDQVSSKNICRLDIDRFQKKIQSRSSGGNSELRYMRALKESTLNVQERIPSMESGLHSVLPKKWVFHFHSLPAILMGDASFQNDGLFMAWLNKNWKGAKAFIPPESPGLGLCRILSRKAECNLFFLVSHGVVLHSDDPHILDRWKSLETKFMKTWGRGKKLLFRNRPTPFRYFSPDSVVFEKKIRDVLKGVSGTRDNEKMFLLASGKREDRNYAEIWKATEILFHFHPHLKEWPSNLATKVSRLPMEKLRVRMGEKSCI